MPKNIPVIIVDDEELARDLLRNYLAKRSDITIVAECKNGFEALKAIQDFQPKIVFLDIQMPKLNGFEVLDLLENPPAIIFTTAFDHYALKAFEVNAIDYLLKPFSETRLFEALDKCIDKNITKRSGDSLKNLKSYTGKTEEYLSRVVVKQNRQITIIPVSEMTFLEAQDDYVAIYFDGKTYLKQKTMAYFEKALDPNEFIRVHRSHIVKIDAIQAIEAYEKESHIIILKNSKKVPVSKSGFSKLKQILQ